MWLKTSGDSQSAFDLTRRPSGRLSDATVDGALKAVDQVIPAALLGKVLRCSALAPGLCEAQGAVARTPHSGFDSVMKPKGQASIKMDFEPVPRGAR